MAISSNGNWDDTNESVYVSGPVTVGVTEVEAKVGATRETQRQFVRIYNNSNSVIYFGPTGLSTSTGEPLQKHQSVEVAASDLGVFLIAGSVIVQEIG
jgi:hypothetical protein